MGIVTRRGFLGACGLAAGYSAVTTAWCFGMKEHPGYNLVAEADRNRILTAANRWLSAAPETVTAARCDRSGGGVHDFYSEGDYWWPDPGHPGGAYVRRDGFSNPANFGAHRAALLRLSMIVPCLTAAWKLTGHAEFAHAAGRHLDAWFVNPETRMNPNLQYAQAIYGVSAGRGTGIIDTIHLVEPARAATLLMTGEVLPHAKEVQDWFAQYLEWMRSSSNGREEEGAKNNHGSCWVMQAGEFARFVGNAAVMRECRDRFKNVLVPNQIALNGSLPLELARTKPYSYSLFDLDVLCTIAQSLSTDADNLWTFTTSDARGLRRAVAFLYPYIKDKSAWPYRHDVEFFDDFPSRQPSLLFAGLAYKDSDYVSLWKTLNPDPAVPEVIRNFPIRQPLLWLDKDTSSARLKSVVR